jgi:nucleoside-diphosphate-sugar epimerase
MKKVLVAGGSGFIGTAVVRALTNSGMEIHATCNSKRPIDNDQVTWHRLNLLNKEEVVSLFNEVRPEILIQLAWCTGQGKYWKDVANLEWITANIFIAQQFVANGGQRCVFAGTSAEYDWSGNEPLNEATTPLKPLLLYGGSKLALYWVLTRYFEQESVLFKWVRFFNPFGEGEDRLRLIPKTCLRLLANENLQFDAALSSRDFLHIDDVATAVCSVVLSDVSGAVNIGSGQPVTVRAVITAIADYYSQNSLITFADENMVDGLPDSVTADTARLNVECGFRTEKTFKQRIEQTCEWWRFQYKNQKS